MIRFRDILTGDKGTISIVMAMSMTAVAGFGALGVDYGYIQWKRAQLQMAADSAALAAVDALVAYNASDATSSIPKAQAAAKAYVAKNMAAEDKPDKATTNADIIIDQAANSVEVTVGMTALRGNPVSLIIGKMLGISSSDVVAKAKAASYCIEQAKCLKPWSPPAKFTWNDKCDSNKKYKNNGVFDPGSACEKASVQVQGYTSADRGTKITLKAGDPSTAIAPGQFGAVDYPPTNKGTPVKGASAYRDNICKSSTDCGCPGTPGTSGTSNNVFVQPGDYLLLETGNMTGPTKQGVADLIAQDPAAHVCGCDVIILNSVFTDPMASPRVIMVPFYDPRDPPTSGRTSIQVYQIGLLFLEDISQCSGDVTAAFIDAIVPVRMAKGTVAGTNCLAKGIRLVRDSSRS